jgi:DNA-binding XRE family transcriptional regulator
MKGPRTTRRVPHRRLTELRINAGMSPNDLALRAGVAGKTIRMAEAGFIPSPRTQFAIGRVFDLQPLDLWALEHDGAQRVAA